MGKRKQKRKNKKKGGAYKKPQEELKTDRDKEQVEKPQEILVDDADKEQRRTTRLGAIIAIIAVIGTLCVFLFKMTISSLNVWSEQGVIYWYLQALFLLALSTAVILFTDIVLYVISDLKRYNVEDSNYKQYDSLSDSRYQYLINDFKLYIIVIMFTFALSIPLFTIYNEESERWSSILASCLCAFVVGCLAFTWLKGKSKKVIGKTLLNVGEKIGKLLVVGSFCLIIGVIFVANNKAIIRVSYNTDGTVIICNTSAEKYNGLDIIIRNMADEIIYTKSVEEGELLFAKEDKYVNDKVDGEQVAEGILINNEWLHWKYVFDLKETMNDPGKYYLSIIAHQDGKSALLINSFLINDKEYIFAQNSMEKEY